MTSSSWRGRGRFTFAMLLPPQRPLRSPLGARSRGWPRRSSSWGSRRLRTARWGLEPLDPARDPRRESRRRRLSAILAPIFPRHVNPPEGMISANSWRSTLETDAPQKPPEVRELTLRSVLVGLLVALVIGASYPY